MTSGSTYGLKAGCVLVFFGLTFATGGWPGHEQARGRKGRLQGNYTALYDCMKVPCGCGGIGRHVGFKIQFLRKCEFESRHPHHVRGKRHPDGDAFFPEVPGFCAPAWERGNVCIAIVLADSGMDSHARAWQPQEWIPACAEIAVLRSFTTQKQHRNNTEPDDPVPRSAVS